MPSLVELYQNNPYSLWLAVGALFVVLNLITGVGRLMWPSLAAASIAAVSLAGAHIDLPIEIVIFGFITVVLLLLPRKMNAPRSSYVAEEHADEPPRTRKGKAAMRVGTMDRTSRLVGRIGKTTSEFANGVGRVWIEGAEWGADLESGEFLHSDTPVRVTRINGGVRLQVRALNH